MADVAPEKPKTKKKKATAKEKPSEEQPTDAPKEKKPSKKEKTKPDSEEKTDASRKGSASDASRKISVGDPSQKALVSDTNQKVPVSDGSEKASVDDASRKASVSESGRKASVAEAGRKASVAEAGRKASVAEGSRKASVADTSRKTSLVGDPEAEIGPSYVVPPAATKKDIDLLMDLDESKLLELKEAFELFDLNQDGFIDATDLKLTFQTLGQTDMPDDDIVDMLSEAMDPMDFDAFVILLGYKTIEMDPEAILIEALSQWDYDSSGLISEDRIKHDLMTWGDKFTREEAELALEDAPVYVNKKTGSAMIDYLKFCNTLSGLRKKTKMPGPEDFITQK